MKDTIIEQGLRFYSQWDKDSKKEMRSEIERFLRDDYEIDFNTRQGIEDLKVIADAFRIMFDKAGVSIDWEGILSKGAIEAIENISRILQSQFADVMKKINANANITPQTTVDMGELNKERQILKEELYDLKKREKLLKRGYIAANYQDDSFVGSNISNKEKEDDNLARNAKKIHAYQFKSDNVSGIEGEVRQAQNELLDLATQIEEILSNDESGGNNYDDVIYRAMDKLASLYEMREGLLNSPNSELRSIAQKILKLDDIAGLTELSDRYTVGKYSVESIEDVINNFLTRIGVKAGVSADIQSSIENKSMRLSEIESQLAEIESQANKTAVSLDEVNAAISNQSRHNKSGGFKKVEIKQAQDAIAGNIKTDKDHSIKAYYEAYEDSKGKDFVERNKALLNFLSAYNKYVDGLSEEERASNKVVLTYGEHFKELSQYVDVARESLQLFVNVANNIKPTRTRIKTASNNGVDTSNSTNYDAEPKLQEQNTLVESETEAHLQNTDAINKEREAQERLNDSLKAHFVAATQQQVDVMNGAIDAKESMRLVGASGVLSSVQGNDYSIDVETMVKQLIANLKENIVMSLHDHPNAVDAFTPADIESFIKLYYSQGIKVNGIIANGVIKTIDFTGISQDIAIKIGQSFSDNLSRVANESELFTIDHGNILLSAEIQSLAQSDAGKYREIVDNIIEAVNVALNDAFSQNGLESTIKTFTRPEIPQLSQYLLDVQNGAENAITPIEKLKNLISFMKPNQTFDWSQYADILQQFEDDNIDAIDVINQINKKLKEQVSLIQNKNEVSEQLKNASQGKNEAEVLQKENGILEEKLELLRDFTDQYDNNITQKKRDRLEELGSKEMSEEGLTTREEDRQVRLAEEARVKVEEEARLAAEKAETERVAREEAEKRAKVLEKSVNDERHEKEELAEELNLTQQELEAERSAIEEAEKRAKVAKKIEMVPEIHTNTLLQSGTQLTSTVSLDTPSEQDKMVALREAVAMVTTAIEAKTQAFRDEETAISTIVDNEIAKLNPFEEKLQAIRDIINNIAMSNEIGEGLSNIAVNIINPELPQEDAAQPWAREDTLGTVKGVLEQIQTNTSKISEAKTQQIDLSRLAETLGNIKIQSSITSDVGNVLVAENTLNTVKTAEDTNRSEQEVDDIKQRKTSADATKAQSDAERERESQLKKIASLEKEIGQIQAKKEAETDDDARYALEQEIQFRQYLIDLQKQGITLDAEEEAYQRKKLSIGTSRIKKTVNAENREAVRFSKAQAGVNLSGSVLKKGQNILYGINTSEFSDDTKEKIDYYVNKLNELDAIYERIKKSDTIVSDEDKQKLIEQTQTVSNLTPEIKELINEYERFNGSNATVIGDNTLDASKNLDAIKQQLIDVVMASTNGKASIQGFNYETGELSYVLKTGKNEFTTYTAAIRHADGAIVSVTNDTKKTEGIMDAIKRKTREIMTYFVGSASIGSVISEIKQGITYVREIDSAMVELRKVTEATEKAYTRVMKNASKIAAEVGSTMKDVIASEADFARLGYSIADAEELSKTAQILMNVSEFTDINTATDSLISALKGFGYSAQESLHVVDIFNTIGNNYAIATSDLASSLTQSASALQLAGNSLEQSTALITAGNTILQDPSTVSTAMKVISLRIRGVTSDLKEMGEETDDVLNKSRLQAKIKALTGVDLVDATGQFRSTYDILVDIGEVYDKLDSMSQSSVLELLAGKTRANALAAIIQNVDVLKDAYASALDSSGSAVKELNVYMDSIQGKLDQFTNAIQTMWNNFLDADVIKWFVDLGTKLVQLIDKVGLLGTALIGLTAFKGIKVLFASFKDAGITLASVLKYVNSLTVGFKANAASQVIAKGATLGNTLANKLFRNELVKTLATQYLEAKASKALEVAKHNLKLAEIGLLNGTATTADVQAAQTAVETASIPVDITKMTTTELLSAAFKGLALSIWGAVKAIGAFLLTNPLALAALATVAIVGVVHVIDAITKSTEELKEELDNLKSELSDIRSEIDSLNSELETTQDRMAELLAMPSLSFAEEEELENLQKQNDELEREIALLKNRNKIKSSEADATFVKTMQSKEKDTYQNWSLFENDRATKVGFNWTTIWKNIIGEGLLDVIFGNQSMKAKTTEELYDYYLEQYQQLEKDLTSAQTKEEIDRIKEKKDLYAGYIQDIVDDYNNTAEGIEYGDNSEVNRWLDKVKNLEDRWAIINNGDNAKSNAIKRIFNKPEFDDISDTIDSLTEKLKANPNDLTIISQISAECKKAETDLQAVGLSIQDAVDHFTMSSSSGADDILAQYQKGIEALKHGENLVYQYIGKDGNNKTIRWNDLFDWDEETKTATVKSTEIAKVLQGTSEEVREKFGQLVEDVVEGKKTFDEAITSFSLSGLIEYSKTLETQFGEFNKSIFKGLDDDISGFIDTFEELSTALENVADSMDLVHTAQQQMNSSGRISVKTALELIESTDDWQKILTITEGSITLNSNAEEILVQSKLNTIKANIDEALSQTQLQLAALDGAEAVLISAEASDVTTEAYQTYTEAMNSYSASIAGFGAALDALVNSNFRSVLSSFKTAYNAAKTVQSDQAKVDSTALKQKIADLQAQKKILENVDTVSDFQNNYDYDKTSGDKYKDTGLSDALDNLKKKYEYTISNYENQQTYLQNEIARLEAEDKGVSKSYYEKQISIEEQKLGVYEQERTALKDLLGQTKKGTEQWFEVANSIWSVEHAIQESTTKMIEFRKQINELYKTAFDNIQKAYDNQEDLLNDRKSYIEGWMDLLDLKDELAPVNAYENILTLEKENRASQVAELKSLQDLYNEGISSGSLDPMSDEAIEMHSNMRKLEKSIQDVDIAIQQTNKDIEELYLKGWEKVFEAYNNRDQYYQNQQDFAESYIDRLGKMSIDIPDKAHQKLIEIQNLRNKNMEEQIATANADLEDIGNRFGIGSDVYIEKRQEVVELEKNLYDGQSKVLEYEQEILNNNFEKFNRIIDRINDGVDDLNNVADLLSDEDVTLEDGTWTKEGITRLGILHQQMGIYKETIQTVAEEMDKLNASYKNGERSEQDYYEKLQSLKTQQWDAIQAYHDSEKAIEDMNNARIDMIEKGLGKEIDAYKELIELKKKELNSERDLYEFKKNTEKQSKNIAELERKIASLSGSDNQADIAARRKLESDLYNAKEELNDSNYDRSKQSQIDALDEEAQKYEDSFNKYVENLRETLENSKTFIGDTFADVMSNADTVLSTIQELSQTYGFDMDSSINSNLMLPWINGANEAQTFKNYLNENIPGLINEDGVLSVFNANGTIALTNPFEQGTQKAELFNQYIIEKLPLMIGSDGILTSINNADITDPFISGSIAAQNFQNNVTEFINGNNGIKDIVANSTSNLTSNLRAPWEDASNPDSGAPKAFADEAKKVLEDNINAAKDKSEAMKTNLDNPWKQAYGEGSGLVTWSSEVDAILDKAVQSSKIKGDQIRANLQVSAPSYDAPYNPVSGSTSNLQPSTKPKTQTQPEQPEKKYAGSATGYVILSDGTNLVQNAQTDRAYDNQNAAMIAAKEQVIERLKKIYIKYIVEKNKLPTYIAERDWNDTVSKQVKWNAVTAFYKSGTLGTKKDEWAVTDESWIGDEITLAANKHGQLQYLKKGSAVMPADISANLVEWGKLDPTKINATSPNTGVYVANNAVNKPELNFAFDSLVHVDHCDEGTLKDLEKMVDTKINDFNKRLNYGLKKFS